MSVRFRLFPSVGYRCSSVEGTSAFGQRRRQSTHQRTRVACYPVEFFSISYDVWVRTWVCEFLALDEHLLGRHVEGHSAVMHECSRKTDTLKG